MVRTSGSSKDVYGVLTDRQGSLRALYNASGVVQRFSYDAWGNRRSISGGSLTDSEKASLNSITSRGYTFHEHMDEFGLINMNARFYDPQLGMFVSTDPKASDYYNTYPYSYCSGDPLNRVDPTGEDEWYLDRHGNVVERIITDEHDAFYIVDDDGNMIPGYSVIFNYNTVEDFRTEKFSKKKSDGNIISGEFDIYVIRGDCNATELFEMLAYITQESEIEWGHIKAGVEGDKGLNFITTSHLERTEPGFVILAENLINNRYTIRGLTHSHPRSPNVSTGDEKNKKQIVDHFNKFGIKVPEFSIFFVKKYKYYPY